MPGTYSQMYIHIVFAVKGRQRLIHPSWEENLYRYITGIVTNKGQKLLAINGMPDHIHMLIGMKPSCCLSDLVREIKKSSNEFIKENGFTDLHFNWQEGFGAFTCGYSQLDTVIAYIRRQKEHHRVKPYDEEFREFLETYQIEYQEKYLFDAKKIN
ncbi:MAG: IS200/IS605 family transposase [Bacteroidota bacterium]